MSRATREDDIKTIREKQDEQRRVKLEEIQRQVDNGSLVVRKMTSKERAQYPRRHVPPKQKRA